MSKLKDIWKVLLDELSFEQQEMYRKFWSDGLAKVEQTYQLERDLNFAKIAIEDLKYQRDLLGGEAAIKKQSDALGEAAIQRIKNEPRPYDDNFHPEGWDEVDGND